MDIPSFSDGSIARWGRRLLLALKLACIDAPRSPTRMRNAGDHTYRVVPVRTDYFSRTTPVLTHSTSFASVTPTPVLIIQRWAQLMFIPVELRGLYTNAWNPWVYVERPWDRETDVNFVRLTENPWELTCLYMCCLAGQTLSGKEIKRVWCISLRQFHALGFSRGVDWPKRLLM